MIWALGAVGGALALGPALAPGGILHLDFVLLPHAPVPNGVWGLGPELPRRTPLLLPLAWLDPVIGSVAAGKLLVVLAVAVAFAGACRLAAGSPVPWRLAAGALYALNPFVLTRIAVGHVFVVAAMAVLPWVVPWLVGTRRALRLVYLGALALALTGVLGGLFAVALALAGAVRSRSWRWGSASVGVAVLGQVPWLAPGLAVWAQGAHPAGSAGFRTDLNGGGGPLRILGGLGFWQDSFQVGAGSATLVTAAAVALVALACLGHRRLDPELRAPLAVLAGGAVAWVVLSGWTATSGLYDALTSMPGGAALREGQRVLPLYLLWLAPAAALGGGVLAGRLRRGGALAVAAPTVIALLVVGPLLWGSGGQLHSTRVPDDWAAARALVRAESGTVLALPWFQYISLDLAEGARVLNPLPLWLGGDVLTASNPHLPGGSGLERDDPREPTATRLVAASLRGTRIGPGLAALGVRWVVVLRDGDLVGGVPVGVLESDRLRADPGLVRRLSGAHIEVFEVRAWRGEVVTTDGDIVPMRPVITPLATLDASARAVWAQPGAAGWLRGWHPADVAPNGLIVLPAGSGPIWYWPSVLVLFTYMTSLAAIALIARKSRRVDFIEA